MFKLNGLLVISLYVIIQCLSENEKNYRIEENEMKKETIKVNEIIKDDSLNNSNIHIMNDINKNKTTNAMSNETEIDLNKDTNDDNTILNDEIINKENNLLNITNNEKLKDIYDTNKNEKLFQDDFNPYIYNKNLKNKKLYSNGPNVPLDRFDFDPSEGLSFYMGTNENERKECFFEDVKSIGDDINGAYLVSAAKPRINLQITAPNGKIVYERNGDVEGEYLISPSEIGFYKICFLNNDPDPKIVTLVTRKLESQHPVGKQHVSLLAKYASHVDIRLGELESEQRLLQLRTERHMKVQKSTNERVAFYGILESIFYILICLFQVFYIKKMLENPYRRLNRSWA